MSEITIGWVNAANAFGRNDQIARDAMLDFLSGLSVRPDILGIGEFTVSDASQADLVRLGEAFADRGYRLTAVNNYTQPGSGERNVSTMAVLVGQHVVGAQVECVELGPRNGFMVTANGSDHIAILHAPDDDETKRTAYVHKALGELATRAAVDDSTRANGQRLVRAVAIADFNGLSPKDQRWQTRMLRWLGKHTHWAERDFDFYSPNPILRPLGFLIRAIRMASGYSRGLLEAAGMYDANVSHEPTCFHGPRGIFRLAIDDVYVSPEGRITQFQQYVPLGGNGRRLSDHNLLVATVQFPDPASAATV